MSDFSSGMGSGMVPGQGAISKEDRASFGIRLAALLIDSVIFFAISLILSGLGRNAVNAISTLLGLAYYGYFEGSPSGQTVGKKVMNIRVVDKVNGQPLGVPKALIRYVSKIVSAIPCFLGFFWMLWDKEGETWHDKMSGTVVVTTTNHPVDKWPG